MSPSTKSSGDELWRYAVALYGRERVAEACLTLQNDFGADVAVLLYACWRWHEQRPAGERELWAAHCRLDAVRERILRPLRGLRVDWKLAVDGVPRGEQRALREQLLEVELQAERIALGMLARLEPNGDEALLPDALRAYLGRLAVLDRAAEDAVEVLACVSR